MRITLKNDFGNIKQCKVGFSWTTFFFGFFVPVFRGDFKWALIILALDILAWLVALGIGSLVVNICFCFFYNKIYINDLLQKGYKAVTEADLEILRVKM